MSIWILTFILTMSNYGANSSPAIVIYSEEYLSSEACEDSKNKFLALPTVPDSSIRQSKQAYCSKK